MPRYDSKVYDSKINAFAPSDGGNIVYRSAGGAGSSAAASGSTQKPQTPDKPASMDFSPYLKTPRYSFDDVILPDRTRSTLETLLAEITYQDLIFTQWGMAEKHRLDRALSINLAGPSGTGKTLTAEALASALKRQILIVPYQQLESKYVGETPKNIAAAFACATTHRAVLFFDEADSFLGKRLESVTQSTDTAVNLTRSVMLTQLSDYEGIVIFATNLLRNYDSAFISRIRWKITFELPDAQARQRIWKVQLPDRLPRAAIDFEALANQFDQVSGRDIKNAVFQAVVRAAREDKPETAKCVRQEHFVQAMTAVQAANQAAMAQTLTLLTPVKGETPLPPPGVAQPLDPPAPTSDVRAISDFPV